MADIKLVALDMDGTTYKWGGDIIPENIKPIQEALQKGVEVVLVTGRDALSPNNNFIENGFGKYGKSFVVACNGACTYDFKNHELIDQKPIDAATAKKIFEMAELPENKGMTVSGYVNDLHTNIDSRIKGKVKDETIKTTTFFKGKMYGFEATKDDWHYSFFKMMAFNITPKVVKQLEDMGLDIAVNHHGQNCEINAHGVNKGTAVAWLAKQAGIGPENVMAIGDGANDIPMIEYAGYGASLENSNTRVKKVAKIHIPRTNEEGGVAYAINKYVLNK